MSITSVKNDNIGDSSFINAQTPIPPTISGYSVNGIDDTALDPAGGQTVLLNGTGFQRGATITLNGSAIAVVSYVSSNQLSFTSPALSAGTYAIYVVNADLGTAIYIPGLIYSNLPSWTTAAGSLGSYYETTSISNTVVATGDAPITYSLYSGSLPSGATLYANGLISGTAPVDSGSTTYSFTVRATDAQLQDSNRSFSLTINTDVVTWTNPTNGATINLTGTAYSNVLTASDAAGYSIASFTANALPTGLTLSGNTISGTPTVAGNTTTLLTATAATTGRSATNTVTWVVNLGDVYFKYVTSLLSTSTPTPTPFNTDNSVNNAVLTVNGDTRPYNFNPYTPGYYSVQFNGSSDYLTLNSYPTLATTTTPFTLECWVYPTTQLSGTAIISQNFAGSGTIPFAIFGATNISTNTSGANLCAGYYTGSAWVGISSSSTLTLNTWSHIALVFNGTVATLYLNGTSIGTSTTSWITGGNTPFIIGRRWDATATPYFAGYISNVRFVNGTAVYTTTFTPPTSPLTAIANTGLLTCQSNRFIDNSTNAYAIALNGSPQIKSFVPYIPNSSYSTYGSTYFDGNGDYLTVTDSGNWTFGTGNFTIECWINTSTTTQQYGKRVVEHYTYISVDYGWVLQVLKTGGGTVAFSGWTTGTQAVSLSTSNTLTPNTWHHIAVVRSGSNASLYLDGTRVATQAGVTWNDVNTITAGLEIGAQNTQAGTAYDGYITDLRIVKGTAVYDPTLTTLTVPTAPLTAVANTVLLTCQSNQPVANNTFLDNSTNNFSITRNGNTTQGTFSPYGAGFSNYFDGTGDYLQTPANGAFQLTGDFTVEAWVYITTLNSYNMVFGSANATGPDYFAIRSNNTLELAIANASYPAWSFTWALNTWYHVAVTRSGSTLRAFVNGNALTLSSGSATNSSQYFQTGDGIQIGRWGLGSPIYYFTGYISNARIVKGTAVYTSAFTPSTTPLQAITNTSLLTSQSPRFVDNSANNFTITRNGDTSVQKFSPFAGTTLPTPYYGAYFDGTGDYLTIPDNNAFNLSTNDFTLEAWVYITAAPASSGGIIGKQRGAASFGEYAFSINSSRQLNFGATTGGESGSSWTLTTLTGTTALALNTWYHTAVVRSGTAFKLYVNGTQDASSTASGAVTDGTSSLSIGSNKDGGQFPITGYISNARVVNGTAVYTTNFTPSTTPLTAIANTNLLTCQSSTFIDNSTNNFTITANGDSKPTTFNPFTVTYSTGQSYTPAVFGGSMYFDGNGDYLTNTSGAKAAVFGTGDFTFEVWLYITIAINTNEWDIFEAQPTAGCFQLYKAGTSNNFCYGTFGSTGNTILTSANIPLNQWFHVAVVRSGSGSNNVKTYVNGIFQAQFTDTTNYNQTGISIGGRNTGANYFTGYISDMRAITGQALYTSNFVPQNTPLQAVKNTTLLTNGTSAGIYDSSEISNYETVGDTKINNFGPYNGSYYSAYFDGNGDYLSIASSSAFNISGNFTIEGWYNFAALPGAGTNDNLWLFSGATTYNPYLYLWGDGTLILRTAQTSGTVFTYTHNFSLGVWYHIAVVKSGTTFTLYINGVSSSTGTSSAIVSENKSLLIGDSSTFGLNGYLSNFRVVNGTAVYTTNFTPSTTPLTAIANTSLLTCQSNKFVDNSTNNFTITRVGDTKVVTQNPFQANTGECIYFDGTGDYLISPNYPTFNLGSSNFTIEGWFYITSNVTAGLISKWTDGGNQRSWKLDARSNGTFTFYYSTTGSDFPVVTFTGGLDVNSWTHLALVRNSSTLVLYKNGTSLGSSAFSSTIFASTSQFCLGVWLVSTSTPETTGVVAYPGYMSDVRITNGVARYTTTFTPPTSPFTNK